MVIITSYDKIDKINRTRINVCAEHLQDGKILYRLVKCKDCGKFFRIEQCGGSFLKRCVKCIPAHKQRVKKERSIRDCLRQQERKKVKIELFEVSKIPKFCKEICGMFCIKEEAVFEVRCGIDLQRRHHE
jgi:hypothetical protein